MGTADILLTSSDTSRSLISIDSLSAADVHSLIREARSCLKSAPSFPGVSACLLMLQPSLRTRLGFSEAVARLGGRAHVITSSRHTAEASASESLWDTIRIASGMVDLIIVRAGCSLAELTDASKVPLLNAGDADEHPTQALIDLFAIEQLRGSIGSLSIGVCGDLSMRVPRSLLKAFALIPPRQLRLIAPQGRIGDAVMLTSRLGDRVEFSAAASWEDLDVLYMAGLPERSGSSIMDAGARGEFALTAANVDRLPANACVLSPMPIIDEIAPALRQDSRICAYTQSDLGMAMRIAVLTGMLNKTTRSAYD
jgi:aspartate carbamoyltransferase catalytic subunit